MAWWQPACQKLAIRPIEPHFKMQAYLGNSIFEECIDHIPEDEQQFDLIE